MTADTSAVIAALSEFHDAHEAAARALASVTVLPAHAMIETYSVLTRLPAGLAIPGTTAAATLTQRFGMAPLRLSNASRGSVLETLATAGVQGGATYDGLVGLEAAEHGETLFTLDERAQPTYRRLGIPFEVITP